MELGMEPEAASSIAEAIARATADEDRIDLAYALRASAMLAIRQHRRADAHQTLDQALDLVRQMNVPYSEAYYLTLYGVLYKEQGATEEARARFQEALTIFHRLGAKRDVERVQAAIAHS
jgi:tetratricopeptide (TPR) repeat protein